MVGDLAIVQILEVSENKHLGVSPVEAGESRPQQVAELATGMQPFRLGIRIGGRYFRRDLQRGLLNELGILHAEQQNWSAALQVFEETEEFFRHQGDRIGTLRAVFNRAITYYRLQDLDRAESLFREARRVSDEIGRHPQGLDLTALGLGEQIEVGQLPDAQADVPGGGVDRRVPQGLQVARQIADQLILRHRRWAQRYCSG